MGRACSHRSGSAHLICRAAERASCQNRSALAADARKVRKEQRFMPNALGRQSEPDIPHPASPRPHCRTSSRCGTPFLRRASTEGLPRAAWSAPNRHCSGKMARPLVVTVQILSYTLERTGLSAGVVCLNSARPYRSGKSGRSSKSFFSPLSCFSMLNFFEYLAQTRRANMRKSGHR